MSVTVPAPHINRVTVVFTAVFAVAVAIALALALAIANNGSSDPITPARASSLETPAGTGDHLGSADAQEHWSTGSGRSQGSADAAAAWNR
jgi:hypothetical protein